MMRAYETVVFFRFLIASNAAFSLATTPSLVNFSATASRLPAAAHLIHENSLSYWINTGMCAAVFRGRHPARKRVILFFEKRDEARYGAMVRRDSIYQKKRGEGPPSLVHGNMKDSKMASQVSSG